MILINKQHAFIHVIFIFTLLLLLPALAAAAPVGTFTKVEGNVDILRSAAGRAETAKVGYPVSLGDAVRTKRNGKAEIQFRDDSLLQLAPESRITIDEYTFRGGDERGKSLISLLRGKVRAIVSKLKTAVLPVSRTDSSFNVRTPTAIAGVKGTDFIVYYERGVTGIIFLDGYGFVYNPGRPDRVVPIKAGQATFVPNGSEPPLDAHPVSDAFIAPHLRDTTIALTGASTDAGMADLLQAGVGMQAEAAAGQTDAAPVSATAPAMAEAAPEHAAPDDAGARPDAEPPITQDDITVNIAASNTTYGALTAYETALHDFGPAMPGAGGTPIVFDTLGGPLGPSADIAASVVPPITDTHPALLGTPVTVNVTIP